MDGRFEYRTGDIVMAPWMDDGFLYPAVVVELDGATAHVAYLDGDENDVSVEELYRHEIGLNSRVSVNYKGQRLYYTGRIVSRNGMAFKIEYEDGEHGWTTLAQCRFHFREIAWNSQSEEQA